MSRSVVDNSGVIAALEAQGVRIFQHGGPTGPDPEHPSINLRESELRAFGIRTQDPLHAISVEAFGPADEGVTERRWLAARRAERESLLNDWRAAGLRPPEGYDGDLGVPVP